MPIGEMSIVDCRLSIVDCRLAIGDWRLAIGDWRWAVQSTIARLTIDNR
jgi:hypothetical protein